MEQEAAAAAVAVALLPGQASLYHSTHLHPFLLPLQQEQDWGQLQLVTGVSLQAKPAASLPRALPSLLPSELPSMEGPLEEGGLQQEELLPP